MANAYSSKSSRGSTAGSVVAGGNFGEDSGPIFENGEWQEEGAGGQHGEWQAEGAGGQLLGVTVAGSKMGVDTLGWGQGGEEEYGQGRWLGSSPQAARHQGYYQQVGWVKLAREGRVWSVSGVVWS